MKNNNKFTHSLFVKALYSIGALSLLYGCNQNDEHDQIETRFKIQTDVQGPGVAAFDAQLFDPGSSVNLVLTPDSGTIIKSASGCGGNLDGSSFNIPTVERSCTVDIEFGLGIEAVAGAGGSLAVDFHAISVGDTASFVFTPDTGYELTAVTGCAGTLDVANNLFTTEALDSACTATATFELQKFQTKVELSPNGTVDQSEQTVEYGNTAQFVFTPETDYFPTVSGCNGTLDGNTFITNAITEACTLTVDFVHKSELVVEMAITSAVTQVIEDESIQLTAEYTLIDGSKHPLEAGEWSVSDDKASVSQTGLLTGITHGATTVDVKYKGKSLETPLNLDVIRQIKVYGHLDGDTFVARQTDGTLKAWGQATEGADMSLVADDLVNVKSITSTINSHAALKEDNTVVSWGLESYGGVMSDELKAKLVDVKAVYSNFYAFVALHFDGSLTVWGYESRGGELPDSIDNSNFVNVFGHYKGFSALKADGTLVAWGDENTGADTSSVDADLVNVVSVQYNNYGLAATRLDGNVVTWGDAANQDRGPDSSAVQSELKNVVQIETTFRAFTALTDNGNVVSWGDDGYTSGYADIKDKLVGVKAIYSNNYSFAAILADDSVVSWGYQSRGGDSSDVTADLVNVVDIAADYKSYAALRADGTVVTWGESSLGGDSSAVQDQLVNIKKIYANEQGFAAVTQDNNLVTWGDFDIQPPAEGVSNIKYIVPNETSFTAVTFDKQVIAWGSDVDGGDNSGVTVE